MEDHKINEFPRPPEASDWAQDALVPKKPPFSANRREQLLDNIRLQLVFDLRNVKLLRQVSWCCVGAGSVCLVSCLYYLPFIAVAIAAGFMALLVRIVKNIFQQAIDMKAELDLTI